MRTRRLGRTGHRSSVAILGGAAFWDADRATADGPFHTALDRGVNHLDIAPAYGNAEEAVGSFIPAVRDRLFVGCKTGRSNPDGVREQLQTSLERLHVDHVDLYQLHGVTDLDVLDQRSAAAEAILQAREDGLTRFVGITGHDLGTPRAQLEALRRWDLDTVMFPIAPRLWSEPAYVADVTALLAHCARHDVGVQIIKAASWRPWGDQDPTHLTWYEPQQEPVLIQRGVDFALSTAGVHCFATPGDRDILPLALDAADAFTPMSDDDRAEAIAATADDPLIFPIAQNAVSR